MDTVTASEALKLLDKLLGQVVETHEPVLITGDGANAVLVAEDDWRALNETLHLVSTPGMRESIVEGMDTPVEECEGECDFW
jgi:antitoxin YefM